MADVIVNRAKELGVETFCFAWEKGAIAKASADHFIPLSVTEKEEIAKLCLEYKVDGVVAAASVALQTAAFVADKLNLVGNSLEVSLQIGNKNYVREMTKNVVGLSQIRYEVFDDISKFNDNEWKFPVIFKPTNSGGKNGVIIVNSSDEVEKAFTYAKKGHERVIVEEYIGGKEYSVESLSYRGKHYVIQVTDKDNSGSPHFIELAHHQPAELSLEMRKRVENVIQNILSAVGIQNGPCHTEIKICNGCIYLIEVNGRLGGDHISYPLTELSSGYPYITGVINVALDKFDPEELKGHDTAYASVFFVTKQTSYLKNVFDLCQKYEWCYKKNVATDELVSLEHNDGFRVNYFIYYSKEKTAKELLFDGNQMIKSYLEGRK